MTMTDACGYAVTLDDAAARDAWNACVTAFLAHGASTPQHLGATLAACPGFAMGHATMGFFQLLLGRRETVAAARAALARAQAAADAGGADARERLFVAALETALSGRLSAAADQLDALLLRWPRDSLAMKLGHAIRFVLGDAAGMRRSVEAVADAFRDHPHAGYAAGCHAFALEETAAYDAAEARGRAGLALAPDDAWGLHAVAHVYEMTARPDDGVRLLVGATGQWAHCNNFGGHVWWHLALFHLDRGATGPALALYDSKVRETKTDDYRDIANAASLLARLEIEDVAVGARWDELAALASGRVGDGGNVFADLHYLMALNGAGRTAEGALLAERLALRDAAGAGDMAQAAAEAGVPAARGLCAFAAGAHRAAYSQLMQAWRVLPRIGGSHAQRDVFMRLMVEAAMRGGLYDEAEAALGARTRNRRGVDPYTARRRDEIAALRMAAGAGQGAGQGASQGASQRADNAASGASPLHA